jgi:hypothetical protein
VKTVAATAVISLQLHIEVRDFENEERHGKGL